MVADLQQIASDDWMVTKSPTIGVPGDPHKFRPPQMPLVLKPDAIAFAKAQESANCPKLYMFRLEALAQACLRLNPAFTLQGVDILCGLNNLRKIFEFVSKKRGKAFRIGAELSNGTVMMTRWEHLKESMSQTSRCRGYGVNLRWRALRRKEDWPSRPVITELFRADDGIVHSIAQLLARDSTSAKRYRSQGDLSGRSPSLLNIVDIGEKHGSNCLIEIKSRDHKNRNLV
ncbi:hypothetical protein Q7P37_009942 [Cladosporium fusiforme]